MAWTGCKKDEDWNSKWGRNGHTAKLMAAQTCSDWGYYSHRIHDCGGWRFQAECWEGVPWDWSTPMHDEGAREKGYSHRNDYAYHSCRGKGYMGADGGAWRDKGEWMFSLACRNPGWKSEWWDEGCRSDGTQQVARWVEANGMDWHESSEWMKDKHVGSHIWGRPVYGKWSRRDWDKQVVAANIENSGCLGGWATGWYDDGCQADGNQKYAAKVDAKARRWEDAAAHMLGTIGGTLHGKHVVEKRQDNRGAGGMWVDIRVANNDCKGGWKNDWIDDGCQKDGRQKYARWVDAKGRSWEAAADHMLSTVGGTLFGKPVVDKRQDNRGHSMWVDVRTANDECYGKWHDDRWWDDGCQQDRTRRYNRKINAMRRDWPVAGDHVVANLIGSTVENKPVVSKWKELPWGDTGVWAVVKVADAACEPDYHGSDWKDDGCQPDGSRRFARQVNDKAMKNWELAAELLIAGDKTPKVGQIWRGGKVRSVSTEYNNGLWVIIIVEDYRCFGEWKDDRWWDDGCQKDQTRRYNRKIEAYRRDWKVAGDHVVANLIGSTVENKNVTQKWKELPWGDTGVWGIVKVEDVDCQADYHGADWTEDGCQADGSRRFARKVNDKAMGDWEGAAAIVIASNKTPKVGDIWRGGRVKSVSTEKNNGMWVIVTIEDNKCYGEWLDGGWKDDGCQKDTTKRYSRKIQAYKRRWEDAGDHVVANLIGGTVENKTVKDKWKEIPWDKSGVWGIVKVEDNDCKPDYHGNDWNDDGCEADGSRRFARKVNDKAMGNWELAAEMLIAGDKTPKVGQNWRGGKVISVNSEHKGAAGMWVIVKIEDNRCYGEWLDDAWKDDGCQRDQTKRYSRKVQAYKRDWDTAGEHVVANYIGSSVENKPVKDKWKEKNASGVWGIVKVEDVDCQPDYHGSDWNDDGCVGDNTRRYARKVNDKGMGNWELAADTLIAGDKTPKVGSYWRGGKVKEVFRDNKGLAGMWVVVIVEDNRCMGEWLDGAWKDDGCQRDQTKRYSRKIQAHKRKWEDAGDYVVQNLISEKVENKPIQDKWKEQNASGVWGVVKVEDVDCQPAYHGSDWNDDGCEPDGSRRFARKVNDKAMNNWELAADLLIESDETPKVGDNWKNGKVKSVNRENKGAAGMWVIVTIEDNRCYGEWLDGAWKDDGCQNDQTKRYSRKVQAYKRDWDTAGEHVVANYIGKTVEDKKVINKWKEKNSSGVWGIVKVEDIDCQPDYHGNDWNDDGCEPDGTRRYARKVNDKAMGNWELAADLLIAGDKTPKVGQLWRDGKVKSVTRENKGAAGMWVIVIVEDNRCFGEWLDGGWNDDGCQKDQTRRYNRKVQAHKRDWDTAGEHVINTYIAERVQDKKVINKWKEKHASGVWGIVKVEDVDCQADYHGVDWNDDGCEPDGTRRFARKVNDKAMGNWEAAADQLIAGDKTPKVGQTWRGGVVKSVTRENKGAAGMWVIVTIEDNRCFGEWLDGAWKDDGCQKDQTKRYSRKVQAYKRDWDTAGEYVVANLIGKTVEDKPVTDKWKEKNASGVWGIVKVEDVDCQPDYHGNDWNDDGCEPDGTRRYARQVNDKAMGNWEAAADQLIAGDKTPKVGQTWRGGKVKSVTRENKGVAGMWVIVIVEDNRCFGEWLDDKWKDDGCQRDQTKRYSRKVQAYKRDWETAGDHVVANLIGKTVEDKPVTDKWKEKNPSGVWGVVKVEDVDCQPDYHGDDWNDDGCEADGTRRYARKVNDKAMGNWEAAADQLIAGDKTPKVDQTWRGGKVTQVYRENKGAAGMWVIVIVEDNRCFGEWLDNKWNDDGCQKDQTRRYNRKVQAYKRDWDTAGEHVVNTYIGTTVEDKRVTQKWKEQNLSGVWGIVKVEDVECHPSYYGDDWNDDGCEPDGSRRFARKVNDKAMGNWEAAADQLMASDKTPKVGDTWRGGKVKSVNRENKGAAGMWVIVIIEDNRCFGEWLDGKWNDDGCQKDQTRRYNRKVQAYKRDWDTAGDHVVSNYIGDKVEDKKILEKWKEKNAAGVWGIVKVEDVECHPSYYGDDWNDDGCSTDGLTRRWARKVNDKAMGNWEAAADQLMASDQTPKVGDAWRNGIVQSVTRENKGAGGMWVVIVVENDKRCFGEWLDGKWNDEGCQKDQSKRYARKINAHKQQWSIAGDYVVENLIGENVENKPVVGKWKEQNLSGVWGVVKVEDVDCQPDYHGDDWNDDGCEADGTRRYARKVNDKAMGNWEAAADQLIAGDKTPKVGDTWRGGKVKSVYRENKGVGGMWVIVTIENERCFGEWLDGGWKDDGCQKDQTKRYSRKVQAYKRDWNSAGEHVVNKYIGDTVENKKVTNKWHETNAFGVWGIATVTDVDCQPDYHGNDWNDDGCEPDGSRRFARKVNDKAMNNWEAAADQLIASDKTPKVGQIWRGGKVKEVFRDHKGVAGMWVVVIIEDNRCYGEWLDDKWKDDGCQKDQTKRYSRKVQAYKRDWDTAGEHVVNTYIGDKVENKKVTEKWKEKNLSGVWGVVKVEDLDCHPDYYGDDWNDDGCIGEKTRRYARKVNDKAMGNWEAAAEQLIASDKTPKVGKNWRDGKVTKVFAENKGLSGMWVIVEVEETRCLGEWKDNTWSDNGCQKDQTRRYSRWIEAYKRKWEDAGDHVVRNLIGETVENKKVKEKWKELPGTGVWGVVKVEDESCTPDYHGNDWNDDGCSEDGLTRRWARQVNDKAMGNWEFAAELLIKSNKTPRVGQTWRGGVVKSVTSEKLGILGSGGMWIVVIVENDKRCFGEWKDDKWKDDGCQKDQTRRYSRWINAHRRSWEDAGDYVVQNLIGEKVEDKQVLSKWKDLPAKSGVWGVVKVEDTSCQPDYHGDDWKHDGCSADGITRRYARQVNDKAMGDWEKAAEILLASDKTPKVGQMWRGGKVVSITTEKNNGLWVIVITHHDGCKGEWADADWKSDGCNKEGTIRRYSRKVEAHKQGWEQAADYLNAQLGDTLKGLKIVQKTYDKPVGATQGIWSWVYVEDSRCKGDWADADWKDDGCQPDKTRRYSRKVEAYQQGWEQAADYVNSTLGDTLKGNKIVKKTYDKPVGGTQGIWSWVYTQDKICDPSIVTKPPPRAKPKPLAPAPAPTPAPAPAKPKPQSSSEDVGPVELKRYVGPTGTDGSSEQQPENNDAFYTLLLVVILLLLSSSSSAGAVTLGLVAL